MVTQQIRQASLGVRKLTPQEWKQYGDAWLVTEGETWVGLITKAKSTKLDLYPWKVFKYTQGPDAPGGAKPGTWVPSMTGTGRIGLRCS